MAPELRALWEQACANVDRQAEMWAAIKRDLGVADFRKVSWVRIYQSKRKLGYPLNAHEIETLRVAGPRPEPPLPRPEPLPPMPAKGVTQDDVDQAEARAAVQLLKEIEQLK